MVLIKWQLQDKVLEQSTLRPWTNNRTNINQYQKKAELTRTLCSLRNQGLLHQILWSVHGHRNFQDQWKPRGTDCFKTQEINIKLNAPIESCSSELRLEIHAVLSISSITSCSHLYQQCGLMWPVLSPLWTYFAWNRGVRAIFAQDHIKTCL